MIRHFLINFYFLKITPWLGVADAVYLVKTIDSFNQYRWISFLIFSFFFLFNICDTERRIPFEQEYQTEKMLFQDLVLSQELCVCVCVWVFSFRKYLIIKSRMSCACGSPEVFWDPNIWQETTWVNFMSANASSWAANLSFPLEIAS